MTARDLHVHALDLCIGGRIFLKNLHWHVAPGECWAVIGRNGAGKSTLLKALAGLRKPDAGTISWQNRELDDWPLPELARLRVYLPQVRRDPFGYTALEMALAARHASGAPGYWDSTQDCEAAMMALERMDVAHLAAQNVRSLSGGERQRVAMAMVLAQEAQTFLLDEPLTGLDIAHQQSVSRLLASEAEQGGRSIIFTSHNLTQISEQATHVLLVMGDGTWHAGEASRMLDVQLLGRCLGHPIEAARVGNRTVFLPAEENRTVIGIER